MKILVTGADGQLGSTVVAKLQSEKVECISFTRSDIDLTSKPEEIAVAIAEQAPDWVVNCAAYTQVDSAEKNTDLAFQINRDAIAAIALGVRECGGQLLHISTDFVFDGVKSTPYKEKDSPSPVNVYGASKAAGEKALLDILPDAIVLRTSWVYGGGGGNFVKSIIRLAKNNTQLRIVDDQLGTPTWTEDLANVIWSLVNSDCKGIYHFSNDGVASWYDFAHAIVSELNLRGCKLMLEDLSPIPTDEYPTPAKRPHYSVMDKTKIRAELQLAVMHWRDSLSLMMSQVDNIEEWL